MKKVLQLIFFIFVTETASAQWQWMNGPNSGMINSVFKQDSTIIGTIEYLWDNFGFISYNNGKNWSTINESSGLQQNASQFFIFDGGIYSGRGSVNLSIDSGKTWNAITPNMSITSMIINGTDIYCGTLNGTVLLSTDTCINWTSISTGLPFDTINALAVQGTTLFAGTANNGVYRSTDWGSSWSDVNNGSSDLEISCFAVLGSRFFAGTYNDYLRFSEDSGNTWNLCPVTFAVDIESDGSNICAATNTGVYFSSDSGSTWSLRSNGLPLPIRTIAFDGQLILAGTHLGLYQSTDYGLNWTMTDGGCAAIRINSMVGTGECLFAAGSMNFWGGGIHVSTDHGFTWTNKSATLPHFDVRALAMSNTGIFASVYSEGIFYSADSGSTWSTINNGLTDFSIESIIIDSTKIFAQGHSAVFLSLDSGSNWIDLQLNIPYLQGMARVGTNLFVIGDSGVFMSPDTGSTWVSKNNGLPIPGPGIYPSSLFYQGNKLFVSYYWSGLYCSIDLGDTWLSINNGLPLNVNGACGAFDGNNYFLGLMGHVLNDSIGVYVSTDNCNSWIEISEGLLEIGSSVVSFLIDGDNIYCGSQFHSVFKRSLSEIYNTVGVSEANQSNANVIIFPNPANSRFTISNNTQYNNLSFEIFNILGKIIYSGRLCERQETINTPFAKGIYIVKLHNSEKQFTMKLAVD